MANYKVVDADQLDADMKSVADAIRAKGGTTESMSFPDGYVSAIGNIEEGTNLPILVNPGEASDVLKGKEFINQAGEIVTGTISSKTASNVTVSKETVTVPAGYYPDTVSKSVASVDQATPTISVSSAGLITASVTQLEGYVAADTKSATRQLTTKSAETFIPKTTDQTISSGKYITGTQTIKGDPNLIAENIADGITIFEVTGTHVGGITPTGTKTISANGTYDVTEYASAEVALPTATQATPSISVSSAGKITATSTQSEGYVEAGTQTATKQLTVQAAKTVTPTTSTQTAVSAGVYTTGSIKVAAMPTATQATPTISINSSGLITASTTQAEGYVSAGTKSATKQLNTLSANEYTPGTGDQKIDAGNYLTGAQTIKGDANLKAENIASGISIFGVSGTYKGLPDGFKAIKTGTFSVSTDTSEAQTIVHSFGVCPDFVYVCMEDATIDSSTIATEYANIVISVCYFYTTYKMSSFMTFPVVYYKIYYDSSGNDCVNVSYAGSLGNTTSISISPGDDRKFKAGITYRWVAGKFE